MNSISFIYRIVLLVLICGSPLAAQFQTPLSVLAAGGGTHGNGSFTASGTLGQTAQGYVTNATVFSLHAGFWEGHAVDIVSTVREKGQLPTAFELHQNYPNPFNPSTLLRFALPVRSAVRLMVYDMLGRPVAELLNEDREAGRHEVRFDGAGLSSGVYIYRISAGNGATENFMQTRHMLLVK